MSQVVHNVIALDVGERRIGVARANSIARLSSPLTTLLHDEQIWRNLGDIIHEHQVQTIVVGLPRNLNGEDTAQTTYVREFVRSLESQFPNIPITLQDEAATSIAAEANLKRQGEYSKADIDAAAAAIILEDYIKEAVWQ